MGRTVPPLIATVAALGLMALAMSSASGANSGHRVVARDSTADHAKFQPDKLRYTLGASTTLRFTDLRPWKNWGNRTTRASGKAIYDDCVPNCGQGTLRTAPAKVRLKRIRFCGRQRVYTKFHFQGGPFGAQAIKLDCRGNQTF